MFKQNESVGDEVTNSKSDSESKKSPQSELFVPKSHEEKKETLYDLDEDVLKLLVGENVDKIVDMFNDIQKTRRKEYLKQYYRDHKDKMMLQTQISRQKRTMEKRQKTILLNEIECEENRFEKKLNRLGIY